jgi:AcrR family transcriptional regulator
MIKSGCKWREGMPKLIDQEKLFQTAIELLVTHGYANTTTKKIAAAAGIHEATLFRKYGSKFELIAQAIEQRLSDTPLNRLVYTGDLEADVMSILQAYVEVSEQHGEIMPVLLFEIARDPTLEKLLQTPWNNLQIIIEIIEKYQAQGKLKKEPPLTTLNVLIGPIMVSAMLRRANTVLALPTLDTYQYVDYFLLGRKG